MQRRDRCSRRLSSGIRKGDYARAAAVDALIVLAVEIVATIGTVVAGTGVGVALRRRLANPRHARTFNIVMALLLVVSIVPMVL